MKNNAFYSARLIPFPLGLLMNVKVVLALVLLALQKQIAFHVSKVISYKLQIV